MSAHSADSEAAQTVGELVERLGSEQAAMTHIVAYNIKLRMAAAEVIASWDGLSQFTMDEAIATLQAALIDGQEAL